MDPKDILAEVTKAVTKASDDFSKQAEAALKEAKNAGSLSTDTKAAVDKLALEVNTLRQSETELKAKLGEAEQAIAAMPAQRGAEAPKSAGEQIIAAESLKVFADRTRGGERGRVSVPVKAALISTGVATGVVEPQRLPGIDAAPRRRLFIRDLIPGGRTTSPAIFWVQMTGFTNNAAVVAENTRKPESTIAFNTKITPVTTIAHIFKASKQILDDFAQLQSTVDAEMRYGLRLAEENEILFGDGTGVHLHGIVPQAQAFAPEFAPTARQNIDDLRLAMLQSQVARFPASGFVLHMIDWAKIELTKDSTGGYILANPRALAGPTLWGLPVVETDLPAFEGKLLAGAFNMGAQIFDREDENVVISTENEDDFVKNMVTIRCEERLGLAVKRPEAFVYGSFGAAVAP